MPYQHFIPGIYNVVTCFLARGNQILILRRSNKVGTFKGKWAGVSGFMDLPAAEQSLKEIQEETGLKPSEVKLLETGLSFEVKDDQNGVTWVIHPFLYSVNSEKPINLDWEHFEHRWIEAVDLPKFDTVPGLEEALRRVLPLERA